MYKNSPFKLVLILGITLAFVSCEQNIETTEDYPTLGVSLKTTVTEDFENGSKPAYAANSVNLESGEWYLADALLGTLSSDRKFDSKSVRIRNEGKITMLFDKETGAGEVSIFHAKYGSDGPSTWELWVSGNGGFTWQKVGNTITTSSTTLTREVFTVNSSGDIRIEIRKISGGSNRINFDNLSITDYESSSLPAPDDDHMLLGNPSNANGNILLENNYLLVKSQYCLSYSNAKLTANWVSWHLCISDLGDAPRQDDFRVDYTLPTNWYYVGSGEYSGSGFDRGHMCPSGDRTSTIADNSSTFLMTNMIPQAPNNNRVTWVALETYSRKLINEGKELFIISGPLGEGGTGSYGYATTVGNGIVVPSHIWKIIVVLEDGSDDLTRITTSTRVIAVLMPNNQTVNAYHWSQYRVSVDDLESITGYDFLSNINSTIQSYLESGIDNGPTS